MSIARDGDIVSLIGRCGVEDAESLLDHLTAGARRIHAGRCEAMHAAILQLLIAAAVRVEGDLPEFLARWDLIDRSATSSDADTG